MSARVVVFFCDFPTCICADDMCSQLCAFWFVFMPFGCVFPLLCVFLDMCARVVVFSAILRRVFLQMTCAFNFVPFSVFSCLLDVFPFVVCVFFWICVHVLQ